MVTGGMMKGKQVQRNELGIQFLWVFMQDPKQNGSSAESSSKRGRRLKVMWECVCPAEGLVCAFVLMLSLGKGAGVGSE